MKKIALPSSGSYVDSHFGHCEAFTIVTLDDAGKVTSKENVPSPAGCGCKSDIVSTLASKGVTVMLAGNLGQGARNVLSSHGIEVFSGFSGTVDEAIAGYVSGDRGSDITCTEHEHGH